MIRTKSLNNTLLLAAAIMLLLTVSPQSAFSQQPDLYSVSITRLLDHPIIGPDTHPSIGENIQGPTLIRVPDWVVNPLGRYYVYFADHKGLYIRLAYADNLTGPWQVHEPGSLHIEDSYFAATRPPISEERLAQMVAQREASGVKMSHDYALELTQPHIASPDVHVDNDKKQIRMYYHGALPDGRQVTRVAVSSDGIDFTCFPEILGSSYFRIFRWSGYYYALGMPGIFYRSQDGMKDFERGGVLFDRDMRHSALKLDGNILSVFYSHVGDNPEKILLATIELPDDWMSWRESESVTVLEPETEYEGADCPLAPSVRDWAPQRVRQLRDPAIFQEGGNTYLLYSVAGEYGIAIARLID